MSDFDAEAERERLREKYEAEEENRKRTQQMSELLLKGATMTNRHCGECGSPIFRYQEQEFCPSCQRTVGDGTDAGSEAAGQPEQGAEAAGQPEQGAEAAGQPEQGTDAGGGSEVDPGETAADASPGAAPGGEPAGGPVSNGVGRAGSAATGPEDASDPERAGSEGQGGSEPAVEGRPTAAPAATAERHGSAPTRRAARESLLAALTRHARLAAETDEPRRATDHLEAAREAAAALDELDGS